MSETSSQRQHIPKIQNYRELIKVKSSQILGAEKARSTLGLAAQSIIRDNDPNIMLSQTNKASIVNSLNFDFGTLGEFLNYDMQLKKPDQLFRMNAGGKKSDNKLGNQEDWKERLMAKDKLDVETRDPKTIMLQEQDMKKVSKAIKQFIKDMELQIFGEDIDAIEERVVKKTRNKLYDLITSTEDIETVKKINEKYSHKPFSERLELLEKKLEQKHEKLRENVHRQSSNIELIVIEKKKKRFTNQKSSMHLDPDTHQNNGRPSSRISDPHNNALQRQESNLRKYGKMPEERLPKSPMFAEHLKSKTLSNSMSPKKHMTLYDDKSVYVNKMISISPFLMKFYSEYEENKEKLKKVTEKALEYGATDFYDIYQTHNKEEIFYLNEKILLMANTKNNPFLLLHVCCCDYSFKNLISLNLFGSDLPDYILNLTLTIILRYDSPLELIDLGGNMISPKVAELLSDIAALNRLRILRLSESEMDSKIISQICIGLAKSNVFEEFDLSHNKIDDFGLKSLVLVLKHSRTIRYIDLRSNNFTDPVLQELDRTIRTNKIMSEKTFKIL